MTVELLLLFCFSPADSCNRLVSVEEIPRQALLYAELAARDGGDGPLLYGRMLELAGRFEEASAVYGIALGTADDPLTEEWLIDRMRGSLPLDTILVLEASVTNPGSVPAHSLLLVMPEPVSHPPYQEVELLGGAFSPDSGLLVCRMDSLGPGETRRVAAFLRIVQRPYSFRPLAGIAGSGALPGLKVLLDGLEVPTEFAGSGPCLDMSLEVLRRSAGLGLEMEVVGGVVRRGDSLVFHAWDVVDCFDEDLPVDPLLWKSDSLRAIGHCPTDVIPLWDLMATGGHELSVYYPRQQAVPCISLKAAFADPPGTMLPFFGQGSRAAEALPLEDSR